MSTKPLNGGIEPAKVWIETDNNLYFPAATSHEKSERRHVDGGCRDCDCDYDYDILMIVVRQIRAHCVAVWRIAPAGFSFAKLAKQFAH